MDRLGNLHTTTSFRNGGRKAGMGIVYDDYSEESGYCGYSQKNEAVRLPHDNDKWEDLNGEIVITRVEV